MKQRINEIITFGSTIDLVFLLILNVLLALLLINNIAML